MASNKETACGAVGDTALVDSDVSSTKLGICRSLCGLSGAGDHLKRCVDGGGHTTAELRGFFGRDRTSSVRFVIISVFAPASDKKSSSSEEDCHLLLLVTVKLFMTSVAAVDLFSLGIRAKA